MTIVKEYVEVTIPELDIKREEAAAVVIKAGRYKVWWDHTHIPPHSNTPEREPDMSVPADMIITEY